MKIDCIRLTKRFIAAEHAAARAALVFGERLFSLKLARMSASSFAFLRGSAPLFYELVAKNPYLLGTGDDEGWIVGDLHLENFGAFRTGSGDDVTFDVNDFDDAARGPRRLDLLRLTTSALLAAPLVGLRGPNALAIGRALLDGYRHGPAKSPPPAVARLLERVRRRSRHQLLENRTEIRRGERRLVRGERYLELPKRWRSSVPEAFERYLSSAGLDPSSEAFAIRDVAFRVAGTGSLGVLRIAVLTRGKGGRDGHWLFDLKEERRPSCSIALGAMKRKHVVEAIGGCLPRPPIALGRTRLGDTPLVGRRLAPQEDKLALGTVGPDVLGEVVPYLGGIVAALHARSGKAPRLERRAVGALLDDAVELAGIHQSAHLAMCRAIEELRR